ncbi:MAG: M15 family metallopeptidase [Syntrophomonadaceae bacterium]|nr:M15 family metallopeptidase [Syntrophomonadaceae bacterium]
MNRRLAGSLLIVLSILLISFFDYRTNYIRAPIEDTVKTAVKEQAADPHTKQEADSEEDKTTLHIEKEAQGATNISQDVLKQGTSSTQCVNENVQPSETITIEPQEKAATASPVKATQVANSEAAKQPIEVSRGTTIASVENKYPNLSKDNGIYGQFYYRDTSGGRIAIDPAWIEENIVTITLPGLNREVQVHKEAADNFIQAFNYIKNGTAIINGKEVSLLSLIRTMDGTFVSRHVNWNPARGLSNHSWGTAMDINASDHFRYVDPGKEPNDPNLILWEKAFKPAGFSWGNSYADSMHFELLK